MYSSVSEEKEKKAQKKLVKGTGTPAEERKEERAVLRKEKRKKARPYLLDLDIRFITLRYPDPFNGIARLQSHRMSHLFGYCGHKAIRMI